MKDFGGVKHVLRALADSRDGPFSRLRVDLSYLVRKPLPSNEFRIYRVADGDDVYVVVGVSVTRPDGLDVLWSLAVETTSEGLAVTGAVELDTNDGVARVYSKSHTTDDPLIAA